MILLKMAVFNLDAATARSMTGQEGMLNALDPLPQPFTPKGGEGGFSKEMLSGLGLCWGKPPLATMDLFGFNQRFL